MDEKKEYIPARLIVRELDLEDIMTASQPETTVNKGVTNYADDASTDVWENIINGGNAG